MQLIPHSFANTVKTTLSHIHTAVTVFSSKLTTQKKNNASFSFRSKQEGPSPLDV